MTEKEKRTLKDGVKNLIGKYKALEHGIIEVLENNIFSFIDSLRKEPVSKDLEEAAKHYLYSNILYDDVYVGNPTDKDCIEMFKAGAEWQKTKDESTTENLGEYINELSKQFPEVSFAKLSRIAVRVAKWQKEHLWKSAEGPDLPIIDREVIALLDNGKVVFAHRPPEFWDGKDIVTGKVTRNYPKTYDKGGWNIPDVKWWLDCLMPKEEPVSKDKFTFTSLPRLLDRIKPTDRVKWYSSRLADALEKEGYITDAKIVRESINLMNGEKVPMATMDEESVSKGLEEASEEFCKSTLVGSPYVKKSAFKAGAKWQKEQMMAKAIDGTARPDDNEIWCNLTSNNLEDGDKVKIIVIKEDEL